MVLSREIHGSLRSWEWSCLQAENSVSRVSQSDVNRSSAFRFVPHTTTPPHQWQTCGTDLKEWHRNAIYVLRGKEHVEKRQLGTVCLKINPAFVSQNKDRPSRSWLLTGLQSGETKPSQESSRSWAVLPAGDNPSPWGTVTRRQHICKRRNGDVGDVKGTCQLQTPQRGALSCASRAPEHPRQSSHRAALLCRQLWCWFVRLCGNTVGVDSSY